MYFGATAFSEAAFASQGIPPYAYVEVNGSRINESTGTVGITADANFGVTGNRLNFTIGNIQIRVNQRVEVTGVATEIGSGLVSIVA